VLEVEYKFKVDDVIRLLKKVGTQHSSAFFIEDEIWGWKGEKKIRKRLKYGLGGSVGVSIDKTRSINETMKTEEKVERIPKDWRLESSYNKIRRSYYINNCEVSLDFYVIGVFCEIEGKLENIEMVARRLGFDPRDNIAEGIDGIFCKEMKEKNIDPPLHWGFRSRGKLQKNRLKDGKLKNAQDLGYFCFINNNDIIYKIRGNES